MTLFSLESFGNNPALIDAEKNCTFSYTQVKASSDKIKSLMGHPRALVFIFCQNKLEEVMAYIGLINSNHVVCLLDAFIHDSFQQYLIELYQPDYIIKSCTSSYDTISEWMGYITIPSPWETLEIYKSQIPNLELIRPLHSKLKLLLTTSGTTGNPKLIRLSSENILENANSIISFLAIDAKERAIATLPFHYSYGLSVLHTHLLAGASIVITQSSVAQKSLWEAIQTYACTSLAGVPYTYKIMERIGFEKLHLPTLRTMTQAGGKLENTLVLKFHDIMHSQGGSFIVMYGQTEATARIAYLPSTYLPKKAGAIGIAIPGGNLSICSEGHQIRTPNYTGELRYQGKNVMLGYAITSSDLMKGDEMNGVLATGDLGYCDEDGIFFVTGRLKRISKVYGLRINLDDIEQELSRFGTVAATTTDTYISIYLENDSTSNCENCIRHLSNLYTIHPSTFQCHIVAQLPRTSSGKIDYNKL